MSENTATSKISPPATNMTGNTHNTEDVTGTRNARMDPYTTNKDYTVVVSKSTQKAAKAQVAKEAREAHRRSREEHERALQLEEDAFRRALISELSYL